MDRIPTKIDSKFRFVLLASNRAEQLIRGAQAKLDKPMNKVTRTAMEEIFQELVEWDYGPGKTEETPAEAASEAPPEAAAE